MIMFSALEKMESNWTLSALLMLPHSIGFINFLQFLVNEFLTCMFGHVMFFVGTVLFDSFHCSSMNLALLGVILTNVLMDDMDKTSLTLMQVGKDDRIWCPICKRGELRENTYLIYCTSCGLQLDIQSDKVLYKMVVCISFCMWWICLLIFTFIFILRARCPYPINLASSIN